LSLKFYHFLKILILIVLVVSLVGFAFLMNSCTPEVCTTWSRFCIATLIGAPSSNEINECPSEVLICPGETAVLYWNVSSDVTSIKITSEFGTTFGPFTATSGSQYVSPLVTTRYTLTAEGKCKSENTVTVHVVTGGETQTLLAKGSPETGVWVVDVSPVTTSTSIVVSLIKTLPCTDGSFWNKWGLKKTDIDSTVTFLDVTDVDTSANDIPLVGSWEFTPKDASYQKDTACFLVTIKCTEVYPTPTPSPFPPYSPPPPTHQ
jgi:hypothetical protein